MRRRAPCQIRHISLLQKVLRILTEAACGLIVSFALNLRLILGLVSGRFFGTHGCLLRMKLLGFKPRTALRACAVAVAGLPRGTQPTGDQVLRRCNEGYGTAYGRTRANDV